MSNTEQTKKDIDAWQRGENKEHRINLLDDLAGEAGILIEFRQVPIDHYGKMSYDQYMIMVQGMAKIRELRRIADRG